MKETLLITRLIFGIFSSGAIGAIAASYFYNEQFPVTVLDEDLLPALLITPTFIVGIITFISIVMPKRKFKTLANEPIDRKLSAYRTYTILRGAMLEGCCMLLSLLYLIFKQELHFYEAIFVLSLLIIFFPRNSRVMIDLRISQKELSEV